MKPYGDDYRARVERRLAAIRIANRDRGRDVLRGMRRAAASSRPRLPSRRRVPALTLALLAAVIFLLIVARAS